MEMMPLYKIIQINIQLWFWLREKWNIRHENTWNNNLGNILPCWVMQVRWPFWPTTKCYLLTNKALLLFIKPLAQVSLTLPNLYQEKTKQHNLLSASSWLMRKNIVDLNKSVFVKNVHVDWSKNYGVKDYWKT